MSYGLARVAVMLIIGPRENAPIDSRAPDRHHGFLVDHVVRHEQGANARRARERGAAVAGAGGTTRHRRLDVRYARALSGARIHPLDAPTCHEHLRSRERAGSQRAADRGRSSRGPGDPRLSAWSLRRGADRAARRAVGDRDRSPAIVDEGRPIADPPRGPDRGQQRPIRRCCPGSARRRRGPVLGPACGRDRRARSAARCRPGAEIATHPRLIPVQDRNAALALDRPPVEFIHGVSGRRRIRQA